MRILGIDPGTRATGYGILEICARPMQLVYVCHGAIKPRSEGIVERLKDIFYGITEVIEAHGPAEVAVETAFHGLNTQSALTLGQARGVILLAATLKDLPVFEYSPAEVKKATCGYGRAEKDQIHSMVCTILNIPRSAVTSRDASDALAVGVCHASSRRMRGMLR